MASFLDTNVVVYAFDADGGQKRTVARELLESGSRSGPGEAFVISTQVLAEFYWAVTRRLRVPVDPAYAELAVDRLSRLTVVPTDAALVRAAIGVARSHELALWDAQIVEAAALAGCDRLYTEDLSDGQVIRGVRVVNPFTGA